MDELRGFNRLYVSGRNGCGCFLVAISFPILLFLVQGCFFNVTEWQRSQVVTGLTKDQVVRLLGAPSSKETNDRVWVYPRGFGGLLFVYFKEDGTVDIAGGF